MSQKVLVVDRLIRVNREGVRVTFYRSLAKASKEETFHLKFIFSSLFSNFLTRMHFASTSSSGRRVLQVVEENAHLIDRKEFALVGTRAQPGPKRAQHRAKNSRSIPKDAGFTTLALGVGIKPGKPTNCTL